MTEREKALDEIMEEGFAHSDEAVDRLNFDESFEERMGDMEHTIRDRAEARKDLDVMFPKKGKRK